MFSWTKRAKNKLPKNVSFFKNPVWSRSSSPPKCGEGAAKNVRITRVRRASYERENVGYNLWLSGGVPLILFIFICFVDAQLWWRDCFEHWCVRTCGSWGGPPIPDVRCHLSREGIVYHCGGDPWNAVFRARLVWTLFQTVDRLINLQNKVIHGG